MKHPAIVLLLLFLSFQLFAQSEMEKNIIPLKLEAGKISTDQLHPMINDMGMYKIVGLGEGTHGTKEFNELRISIIKELIEKKGFRVICFENAFGDSYYFNQWLNAGEPIKDGMKKYLISLWQTKELEALFEWIRKFNQEHADKVSITGMDFNYQAKTTMIIDSELKKLNQEQLTALSGSLYKETLYFDSAWDNQMKGINRNDWGTRMKSARSKLSQIDSIIKANNLPVLHLLQSALLNSKLWHAGESSRDKNMARMAINLVENNKMIIWAHAVHLALQSPFKNNMAGGCGGYIKEQIKDYYALGTGTAKGKYGGTEERFDTRINKMEAYKLPPTKKPGWDDYFSQLKTPSFFIDLRNFKEDEEEKLTSLPLRLIGYGPPQRIMYSDEIKLSELFDGYIFIRDTEAAEYLP